MAHSSRSTLFAPIKLIGVAPPNGYPRYTLSPEPGDDEAKAIWDSIESLIRSQSGAKRKTIVDRRFEILATCRPYPEDARHHNPTLPEESTLFLPQAVYRKIIDHNYRSCSCGKRATGEMVDEHFRFHPVLHRVTYRNLGQDMYVVNGRHEAEKIGEVFGLEVEKVSPPIMHVGGVIESLENRCSLILPDCCLPIFHKHYN